MNYLEIKRQVKHLNLEEQKKTLEKRRMIVDNPKILEKINYSHLIYNFGKHYVEGNDEVTGEIFYKEGTKLSNIYNLFIFNKEMSLQILNIIFEIEHFIKFKIAYYYSKENLLSYLDSKNYIESNDHDKNDKKKEFLETMQKLEEDSRRNYEKNKLSRGKLPIWLLVDHMQLNQINKLLRYTRDQELVNKIYREIGLAGKQNWRTLTNLIVYRNQICHANPIKEKIWEASFKILIIYFEKFQSITKSNYFDELLKSFNNFRFEEKTNLSKEYIIDYLNIPKKYFK